MYYFTMKAVGVSQCTSFKKVTWSLWQELSGWEVTVQVKQVTSQVT